MTLPIEQSKGKTSPVRIGYAIEKINGIDIKHNRLITAVSEIESATSPSANFVIILVVTPPGAIDSNNKPTFNSFGIGNNKAIVRASIGNKITCEIAPTKKSFGSFNTLLKFSKLSPMPNENIMKANISGPAILTNSI